jgi:hypothetical protein
MQECTFNYLYNKETIIIIREGIIYTLLASKHSTLNIQFKKMFNKTTHTNFNEFTVIIIYKKNIARSTIASEYWSDHLLIRWSTNLHFILGGSG